MSALNVGASEWKPPSAAAASTPTAVPPGEAPGLILTAAAVSSASSASSSAAAADGEALDADRPGFLEAGAAGGLAQAARGDGVAFDVGSASTVSEVTETVASIGDIASLGEVAMDDDDASAGTWTVPGEAVLTNTGEKRSFTYGFSDFTIEGEIGIGAFGRVVRVRERRTRRVYAMKTISKKVLRRKRIAQSEWRLERDVLVRIKKHPYVVELCCSFQTPTYFFLVMQYLPGGELFLFLRGRGTFPEDVAAFYAAEVTLALEHLHANGVIHRDLKPENLLMDSAGHVVVTDFGLAKMFESDDELHRTLCGTDAYMAPEMVARRSYGKPVDFWSLGVLIYEMLTGRAPFTAPSTKELHRKILSEKVKWPTFVSGTAIAVLKGLLERQVPRRLGESKSTMFCVGGVAKLKGEPFFNRIEWQPLGYRDCPAPLHPNLDAHAQPEQLAAKVLTDMSSLSVAPSYESGLNTLGADAVSDGDASTVVDFEYLREGAFEAQSSCDGGENDDDDDTTGSLGAADDDDNDPDTPTPHPTKKNNMLPSPASSQADVSSVESPSSSSSSTGGLAMTKKQRQRPPRKRNKKKKTLNIYTGEDEAIPSARKRLDTIPGSPCIAVMVGQPPDLEFLSPPPIEPLPTMPETAPTTIPTNGRSLNQPPNPPRLPRRLAPPR